VVRAYFDSAMVTYTVDRTSGASWSADGRD
jgi:hypothetical protein